MERLPSPPITVDENGDLVVYPSVQAACRELEVYDVETYEVFDSLGYRLRIKTHGYAVIDMRVDDHALPEPVELERRLRRHVARVGPARVGIPDLDRAPLPSVLETLVRFHNAAGSHSSLGGLRSALLRLIRRR